MRHKARTSDSSSPAEGGLFEDGENIFMIKESFMISLGSAQRARSRDNIAPRPCPQPTRPGRQDSSDSWRRTEWLVVLRTPGVIKRSNEYFILHESHAISMRTFCWPFRLKLPLANSARKEQSPLKLAARI